MRPPSGHEAPTVEALEPLPDGRWRVVAGGRPVACLFADRLEALDVRPGQPLAVPPRLLAAAQREDEARALALRWLAARPLTSAELDRRLRARGVPPAVTAAVLRQLARQGLLDDAAVAEDYARTRLQRRPMAAALLQAELERRGVPRAVAQAAAARAVAEAGGEEALARRALAARRAPGAAGEAARLARYLAGRGFAPELVVAVLREAGLPVPDAGAVESA